MAQTSVEWIYNELVVFMTGNSVFETAQELLSHALKMHKAEMHKCASFWRGKENDIEKPIFEQYYNKTYKND
jgi:hypothetical protein